MIDKKAARLRRASKSRAKIRELKIHRLTVYRTSQHVYAQVFESNGDKVLASASTVESCFRNDTSSKKELAKKVGELIARRSLDLGLSKVAFDRSGYQYHGRVKALADAARETGLQF